MPPDTTAARPAVPVEREVPTPLGPGRLVTHGANGDERAALLLSHGAGGGIGAHDLEVLAQRLPGAGYTVHLFEQPWRVAGRAIATAPPTLDVALLAALDLLGADRPVVLGGRSAGARSAARCAPAAAAREAGVLGVLALSFPLHPPRKPEKSRLDELLGVGRPTLVVQGARDAMGRPEEFPAEFSGLPEESQESGGRLPDRAMLVVPGADHSLKVGGAVPDQAACLDLVAAGTRRWLDMLLG